MNAHHMPKCLAVAWSGGADSTALLLYLLEQGYAVQAWHIDHGWSEASTQLALQLKNKASALGIPFSSVKLNKPKQNIEAEARKDRYAAFVQLAKDSGCDDVVLAHHADDQAETVFMRMLQGAGVAGCMGMKLHRKHEQLNIWRPFLHISRSAIEVYLKEKQETWCEDPSNTDHRLWRNKIRGQMFPAMQAKGVCPQALFLRWQKQAERVQQAISVLAEPVVIEKLLHADVGYCQLDWQVWLALPAPVRVYVLQKMIGILFADGKVFGRRHIEAIEQWKVHGGNGWLNLSGCCLYRQGKYLQLCQGNKSLCVERSANVEVKA